MAQLVEQLAFNQWGDVSPLKVRVLLGAQCNLNVTLIIKTVLNVTFGLH
jgi:hypothetical protein